MSDDRLSSWGSSALNPRGPSIGQAQPEQHEEHNEMIERRLYLIGSHILSDRLTWTPTLSGSRRIDLVSLACGLKRVDQGTPSALLRNSTTFAYNLSEEGSTVITNSNNNNSINTNTNTNTNTNANTDTDTNINNNSTNSNSSIHGTIILKRIRY